MSVTLYQGDCLQELGRVSDHSVQLICADLPYGTTNCAWDSVIPLEPLWAHFKRVLAPRGAVVLTASQPFTSTLVQSNPRWFRCEWIWHKSNGGGFLNANRHPLKRHESVLVFSPQQPRYNPQMGVGKAYRCRRAAAGGTTADQTVAGWITENDGQRYPTSVLYFANDTGLHPTQKPLALIEYLIATYSNPGDVVLDPTFGSNTCGEAAVNLGRAYIGIERDPIYFAQGRDRTDAALARARQLPLEGVA